MREARRGIRHLRHLRTKYLGFWWDMLQLVQEKASSARASALAVRGMQSMALCRQSCLQAAFQAAVQQTIQAVRRYSSGFVFAGIPQRSLRNSLRNRKRRVFIPFVGRRPMPGVCTFMAVN